MNLNPKKRLLNLALLIVGTLFTANGGAFATELPTHWVRGGTVYYIGMPDVTAKLLAFEESEKQWAYLEIDANYSDSLYAQASALRAAYPNYPIERMIGTAVGKATLSIESIGVSEQADWKNRPAGPGFGKSLLLSKSQTEALQKATNLGLKISGRLSINFPRIEILEETSLDGKFCEDLFASGNRLEDVLTRYSMFSDRLSRRPVKYPETLVSLRKAMLRECVDLKEPTQIHSVTDLFAMNVVPRSSPPTLKGQATRKTFKTETQTFEVVGPATLGNGRNP